MTFQYEQIKYDKHIFSDSHPNPTEFPETPEIKRKHGSACEYEDTKVLL